MSGAAVFAAVAIALLAGHQAGDYWVQTDRQAARKGLPGWPGRAACAAHVATYTLTLAGCLALAAWWLALPLSAAWVAAGLAVSAVTHYVADRRWPLRRLAGLIPGKAGFWASGTGLASGAAYLDQAWHWFWLFISALVVTRGAR
ncbi:MAG: transcriptional regulator [Streptosporangiaceae bacterium]